VSCIWNPNSPKRSAAVVAAPAPAPVAGVRLLRLPVDTAKLEWEVQYLRTRVEALQTELANVPAPPQLLHRQPVARARAAAAPETAAPVEEEIARLRWRVRFLEGRLAYFEGDTEAGKAEATAEAEEQDAPRAAERGRSDPRPAGSR
jgi:hypothetical protein